MPINSNALIFIPVFFLFAVNLLFLDIVVFSQQKPSSPSQVVVESIPLPTPADQAVHHPVLQKSMRN